MGETESREALSAWFRDPLFLVRRDSEDYGVDVEIEALLNGGEVASNYRAHVQLKASNKAPNADGSYSYPVRRSNLNYLVNSPDSLYVFYARASNALFYEWAHQVYRDHWRECGKTLTVRFRKEVDEKAVEEIWRRIVEGRTASRLQRTTGPSTPPSPGEGLSFGDMERILERATSGPGSEREVARLDLRAPHWPVRDQGIRGTTVAFALTACVELAGFDRSSDSPPPRYSEEFLYWAAKTRTGDPDPEVDGTRLANGVLALERFGICTGDEFPYDPRATGSQEPGMEARESAATRRRRCGFYTQKASARTLHYLLEALERPVAISLPVFADPTTGDTNWNTTLALLYGHVIDPPPTSVVCGGQAVCVTGFVPDAEAPGGGSFVFRNSWGSGWGSEGPEEEWGAPERGYGVVSWPYVDKYTWELCVI